MVFGKDIDIDTARSHGQRHAEPMGCPSSGMGKITHSKNQKKSHVFSFQQVNHKKIAFWFATGGAGFCLSRPVLERMSELLEKESFETTGENIRLPDDVTLGYIVEHKLGVPLTTVKQFHSHLEALKLIPNDELSDQVITRKTYVISGFFHLSFPCRSRSAMPNIRIRRKIQCQCPRYQVVKTQQDSSRFTVFCSLVQSRNACKKNLRHFSLKNIHPEERNHQIFCL